MRYISEKIACGRDTSKMCVWCRPWTRMTRVKTLVSRTRVSSTDKAKSKPGQSKKFAVDATAVRCSNWTIGRRYVGAQLASYLR